MPAGDDRPAMAQLFAAIDHPELAEDDGFRAIEGRTAHIDALYALLAERNADAHHRRVARAPRSFDGAEWRGQRPCQGWSPTLNCADRLLMPLDHPSEARRWRGDPGPVCGDTG